MTQYDPNAGNPQDQPPAGPPSGPPQAPIQPAGYGYQQPYQQPGYPQQGYQQPVYYPAQAGTNGFAIAAIICAFLCSPLGIVFGVIARNQIKQSHESGDGLALAGIIIGAIFLVLAVLYIIAVFTFFHAVISNPNAFNTIR